MPKDSHGTRTVGAAEAAKPDAGTPRHGFCFSRAQRTRSKVPLAQREDPRPVARHYCERGEGKTLFNFLWVKSRSPPPVRAGSVLAQTRFASSPTRDHGPRPERNRLCRVLGFHDGAARSLRDRADQAHTRFLQCLRAQEFRFAIAARSKAPHGGLTAVSRLAVTSLLPLPLREAPTAEKPAEPPPVRAGVA